MVNTTDTATNGYGGSLQLTVAEDLAGRDNQLLIGTTYDAGHVAFLVVYMLSSLLALAYLLPIPFRAFFSPPADEEMGSEVKEAPLPCVIALSASAIGCLALFVAPGFLYRLLERIVG